MKQKVRRTKSKTIGWSLRKYQRFFRMCYHQYKKRAQNLEEELGYEIQPPCGYTVLPMIKAPRP